MPELLGAPPDCIRNGTPEAPPASDTLLTPRSLKRGSTPPLPSSQALQQFLPPGTPKPLSPIQYMLIFMSLIQLPMHQSPCPSPSSLLLSQGWPFAWLFSWSGPCSIKLIWPHREKLMIFWLQTPGSLVPHRTRVTGF